MSDPGLYLVNSTGEMTPVLTESGDSDIQVLRETLESHGFKLEEHEN